MILVFYDSLFVRLSVCESLAVEKSVVPQWPVVSSPWVAAIFVHVVALQLLSSRDPV